MSHDIVVYLERRAMPTTPAWHQGILDAGYPVKMDRSFDVDTFEGFLPCSIFGAASGFEYYSSRISPHGARERKLPRRFDFSVILLAGRNPLELVSSLAAASVLAHLSGGVVEDPEGGGIIMAESAIAWGRWRISRLSRCTYQVGDASELEWAAASHGLGD